MKIRFLSTLFTLVWAIGAQASDFTVTRYFSGLWEQSHHESQGIVLQIVDQEDEEGNPVAVAYWFTYGDDLETAWYLALGVVEGNQVLMDLYSSSGVGFMEAESPVEPVAIEGTLDLTFHNCNKGTASFVIIPIEGEPMEGEFDIRRLAALYNSRCSGGLSDNTPSDAKPLMLDVELLPPEDGAAGKGKARFWQRADRMDLLVTAEDLTDGDYDIQYCDTVYGTLSVMEGEGAAHFRSPQAEGKTLLVKDPRGCIFNIKQGEATYLTSGENVLAEKQKGPKDKGDKESVKVEIDLDNISSFEDAEGSIEYQEEADEREFEVEIKGLPAASYTLWVAGVEEATLVVTENGEKVKMKFSDPQKEDRELLDFVPWDAIIEIRDEGNLPVLETVFPEAPES
jgi:hypothetical protein